MKKIIYKDEKSISQIQKNSQFEYADINNLVDQILSDIKNDGDRALREFTLKFDRVSLTNFKVTNEEIETAVSRTSRVLVNDLEKAFINILNFHEKQMPQPFKIKNGTSYTGQMIRPIETVAMYVPGGTAAYPSTVLMNAAPAKIAGVKKLIMITPPNENGEVEDVLLVAARVAGIDEIYKIGGAQAIAAVAYGTETIPKVDKIVGPGNIYVAIAKKQVSGYVGIDMIAGPSEVVVIADKYANEKYVAADLLAQAEHDELAKVVLITNSPELINKVTNEITYQTKQLPRKDIIKESLKSNGYIVLTENIEQAINVSNLIAPEHLELQLQEAEKYIPYVFNAGAVFVGENTPETVGDYFAGPNHTLPTSGTARFSSALSTLDFVKRISIINYSNEDLSKNKDSIIRIAEEEGLQAHANAVKVRCD